MSKTALVTGGTGFIGRHAIAPLVERGFDVHVVGRGDVGDGAKFRPAGGTYVDLFDESAVEQIMRNARPTHLLHFAWYTEHGKFWNSDENLRWVRASLNLIQQFAAAGGKRVVCAGTCAEYDWSGGRCSEAETPLIPRTLYGTCKNSLRQMLESYAAVKGLSRAWGRIFFLYGPNETAGRFVPSIVNALRAGEPACCNFGSHVRDFLHAADVADAFVHLLDSNVQGPVNIASGEPLTLGSFAERLADRLGLRDRLHIEHRPATPDNPAEISADVTRLKSEVGWMPRLSIVDGIEDVLAAETSKGLNPEMPNLRLNPFRTRFDPQITQMDADLKSYKI